MLTSLERRDEFRREEFRIDAWSNSDAELFILDGALKIVRTQVGEIHADLPPGIYKLKANRGGATKEQLIELDANKTIYLRIDAFPAIAPIGPILGNDGTKVEALCNQAILEGHQRYGASADVGVMQANTSRHGILFVAHEECSADSLRNPLRGPLHGLRISSWRKVKSAVNVDSAPVVAAETDRDCWAAAWLPAEPGSHLLDFRDGDRRVRQAVLVAPNWQTRVFVRRRRGVGRGTLTSTLPILDRIDLSIQMARPGAPIVYFDHLETIEIARNALETSRPIFVSPQLIDELLHEKFDNPITGLTGLHLFLEAIERRKMSSGENSTMRRIEVDPSLLSRSDAIIDEVLRNLTRLLTDDDASSSLPADLLALLVRANRLPTKKRSILNEPPMFWASWDVLRKSAGHRQGVWIGRSLWNSIAFSGALGPYFAWEPRRTNLGQFLEQAVVGSVVAPSVQPERFTRGATEESFGGPALESFNVRNESLRAQALSPFEIAEALGIPYSVSSSLTRRKEASE